MNEKIAIQGAQGSNHHKVALALYGKDTPIQECLSFDAVVDQLLNGTADKGVMAIENTIAGSIIPNYALIDQNDLQICDEYYLPIHHHLMALSGQTIADIKEVCSHPMALLQCKQFLKEHPHIRLVEDVDTAEVAKRISEQQLRGVAAIAPKIAADLFGLEVLEDEIQTIKNNATRFVVVQRRVTEESLSHNKLDSTNSSTRQRAQGALTNAQINKASLKFELDHKRGSLAAMLNVMSDCKLNLTKIQSLPKIEAPWKYAFFVDVTFDTVADYEKAKAIIDIMAEDLKVLGVYKNGRRS